MTTTLPALLERSAPFELTRDSIDGDGLTLEGYAAVFDTPTLIRSWEGTFNEQIARGAFKKTIRERTPVIQFDHGRHPMVGSIPLGSVSKLSEDSQGLFVAARLHDNWLVQPVRDAIASGSVDGMSFRFEVVRDTWEDSKGNAIDDPDEVMKRIYAGNPKDVLMRTLRELKLPELGPVVFPAYRDTSVAVRSVRDVLADPEGRAELARMLIGTTDVTASEGQPVIDVAASTTDEPLRHSTVTPQARAARLRAAQLRDLGVLHA